MKPYYEQDGITIFHGDCREILPTIEHGIADLILTDPPYGIDFDYGDGHDDDPVAYPSFIWSVIESAERLLKPGGAVVCFQSATNARKWVDWFPRDWRLIALPKTFVQMRPTLLQWATDYVLYWHVEGKTASGFREWQPGVSRDWFVSTLTNIPRSHLLKQHPCPRPIDLVSYLIGCLCPPGGLVVDPFGGSGTTARAAMDLGRRAVVIELEQRYCDLAVRRLAQQVLPIAV